MRESVAVLSAMVLLWGCGQQPDIQRPASSEEAISPVLPDVGVRLQWSQVGTTGSAQLVPAGSGSAVTDSNGSDHGTAFWSLSEVVPSSTYAFQIQVAKDASAQFASLLQVDMQNGATKTSTECAFDVATGEVRGKVGIVTEQMRVEDVGDDWIISCPVDSPVEVDAVYVYVFSAVGPNMANYDPAQQGTIVVRGVGYVLLPQH